MLSFHICPSIFFIIIVAVNIFQLQNSIIVTSWNIIHPSSINIHRLQQQQQQRYITTTPVTTTTSTTTTSCMFRACITTKHRIISTLSIYDSLRIRRCRHHRSSIGSQLLFSTSSSSSTSSLTDNTIIMTQNNDGSTMEIISPTLDTTTTATSATTSTTTTSSSSSGIVPRAAVSVVVRVKCIVHNNNNNTAITNEYHKTNDKDDNGIDDHRYNIQTAKNFYLLIQRGTNPGKGLWSLPGGKVQYLESSFQAAQRELYEETQWYKHHPQQQHMIPTNTDNNNNTQQQQQDQPYTSSVDANQHNVDISTKLQWCSDSILSTDVIGDTYHYVILHYCTEYPNIHVHHDRHKNTYTMTGMDGSTIQLDYLSNNKIKATTAAAANPTTQMDDIPSDIVKSVMYQALPHVIASDDAKDAQWFTYQQIYDIEQQTGNPTSSSNTTTSTMSMSTNKEDGDDSMTTYRITPGVVRVIDRMETFDEKNLFVIT